MIGDNVFVGLLGTSGAWCVSFKAACSYGLGATLGTAYLVLLSRFVENLGKDDTGGGGRGGGGGGGPARLALAGLLVLLVSKNKETFEFIPALTGFLAYQVRGISTWRLHYSLRLRHSRVRISFCLRSLVPFDSLAVIKIVGGKYVEIVEHHALVQEKLLTLIYRKSRQLYLLSGRSRNDYSTRNRIAVG